MIALGIMFSRINDSFLMTVLNELRDNRYKNLVENLEWFVQ